MARELTTLIEPGMIVSDRRGSENDPGDCFPRRGTGLTSNAIPGLCSEHRIQWHYVALAEPIQNGFVESFNKRMRDELLNDPVPQLGIRPDLLAS